MYQLLFGTVSSMCLDSKMEHSTYTKELTTTMVWCERESLPYILIRDGEEEVSWMGGDELYWESMLSQPD